MLFQERDYRHILKSEFTVRNGANPLYSMRAYARDLGISPSRLSEVLSKKQGLSKSVAVKIAKKVQLGKDESRYFVTLVESEHARSEAARSHALGKLSDLREMGSQELKMDSFHVISDWYHFAIMELSRVRNFRSDISWIAKRLGISQVTAQVAVDRLLNTGLLKREKEKLKPGQKNLVSSPTEIPSEAIRSHHRQILDLAKNALLTQELHERDFSTITIAIPEAKIPELKEAIKKFRRSVTKISDESVGLNRVYCLSTQLFALDKKEMP